MVGQQKKTELTLEPPSGFEPGAPRLGIQCPNHYVNGKMYVKCKCPVFINIKQTLYFKVTIE